MLAGVFGSVSRFTQRSGTPLSDDLRRGRRAGGPRRLLRSWRDRDRRSGSAQRHPPKAGRTAGQLDAELRRMADLPDVYLREEANQQHLLTDDDRAAGLRLGGHDRHNLQIEAP